MMCNEITFDKLPEAVAYLIEAVAEIRLLITSQRVDPPKKRIPIGIEEACKIIQKANFKEQEAERLKQKAQELKRSN